MTRLRGLAAAPGQVTAPVWRPQAPQTEAARWSTARAAVRASLVDGAEPLVVVHRLLLDDPALVQPVEAALARGATAEAALAAVAEELSDAALPGRAPAAEEARAVLGRVAAALPPARAAPLPRRPVVLVLTLPAPDRVLALHAAGALAALAMASGSPRSHTALLAAQLGVPAVAGLGAALDALPEGAVVTVDGDTGALTLGDAGPRLRESAVPPMPGFAVRAAIAAPEHAADAMAAGAEGIGLLRTCAAWTAAGAPDRATWTARLRAAQAVLSGAPLVVRTFDRAPSRRERGPALLEAPPTRALVAAAVAVGATVVVPAVSSVAEVRAARAALRAAGAGPSAPLGIMLETPLAVLRADTLLAESDLALVGTNDLVHLMTGVHRDAAPTPGLATACAALADTYSALAGAAARTGRPLFAAGADASVPATARSVRGLGFAGVVVPPGAVDRVRRALVSAHLDTLADET